MKCMQNMYRYPPIRKHGYCKCRSVSGKSMCVAHCMSCRTRLGKTIVVLGWFHKAKALGDLSFDEEGGPLESALRILIVDGVVMLRWVFTTFQNSEKKWK